MRAAREKDRFGHQIIWSRSRACVAEPKSNLGLKSKPIVYIANSRDVETAGVEFAGRSCRLVRQSDAIELIADGQLVSWVVATAKCLGSRRCSPWRRKADGTVLGFCSQNRHEYRKKK